MLFFLISFIILRSKAMEKLLRFLLVLLGIGIGLAAAQLVVLQAQARAVCRLEWGRVSRCLAPLVAPVCGGLSGGGRQPSPSLSGCQWVQATLQGGEGDAVSRAGESLGLHKCPQARYD